MNKYLSRSILKLPRMLGEILLYLIVAMYGVYVVAFACAMVYASITEEWCEAATWIKQAWQKLPWPDDQREYHEIEIRSNDDVGSDGSDDSGDDDLYAFAHAEAEAFPRAWDDARDDFEDDDVFE